jgi:hypothetical protein
MPRLRNEVEDELDVLDLCGGGDSHDSVVDLTGERTVEIDEYSNLKRREGCGVGREANACDVD